MALFCKVSSSCLESLISRFNLSNELPNFVKPIEKRFIFNSKISDRDRALFFMHFLGGAAYDMLLNNVLSLCFLAWAVRFSISDHLIFFIESF